MGGKLRPVIYMTMKRYAFIFKIKPELKAEYIPQYFHITRRAL